MSTRPPAFFAAANEGETPLDPDEATGLLPTWVATRGDLDLAEEENIEKGIRWGRRAIKRARVVTDEFLRELHRRMFGETWSWAGRYRTTERNIGVAPHDVAPAVRMLCDDVAAWEHHDAYTHDERAVRLHHRLTVIHPFPNGNGRCSRVLTDLYLAQNGQRPLGWSLALEKGVRRQRYLECVRAADAHDLAPLLAFMRG